MSGKQSSIRKVVAAMTVILLIAVWALLIASASRMVGKWPVLVQALFYLIMGIAWIIPLKPLIRWSETGRFGTAPKGEN